MKNLWLIRFKKFSAFFLILVFVLIIGFLFSVFFSNIEITRQVLEKAFNSTVKNKNIYEAVLYVEDKNGDFSESFGYGGRDTDTPMWTASVGKLFTTACVLMFCEKEIISLDDKLSVYFNEEQLRGLHIYKGHEYSFDITVYDLLFQTSGLPAGSGMLSDEDEYFSFDQILSDIKTLTPVFPPNSEKKAYYANVNFWMLGEILEKVTGMPLADVYKQMIFIPLEMNNTFLASDENDSIPHFYNGSEKLNRPKRIITSGAAGGFVSTPKDLMIFSKAFWEGRLFDKTFFEKISVYRKLKPYPAIVYYGGGFMRIPLFPGKGEIIGHSGITGSFSFYYPQMNLYFTGDFAQLEKPSAPFLLLLHLVMIARQ